MPVSLANGNSFGTESQVTRTLPYIFRPATPPRR